VTAVWCWEQNRPFRQPSVLEGESRLFDGANPDQRPPYPRDRDRILYSSAFRRLAGVTQVVSPSEGHIFHNRLTHSLKVAQVARGLAEHLREEMGGKGWLPEHIPDPDVAEAAGLGHDLGHPPFGHVGEATLNRMVKGCGNSDGFEGNAQSFRIVSKLTAHRPEYLGLDLCRRTLNALLKYPWFRSSSDDYRSRKFGAYRAEWKEFCFARRGDPTDDRLSVEAQIMNLADDISYGVHDFEDFWRAGLIPVDRIRDSDDTFDTFLWKWGADPKANVSKEELQARKDHLREYLRLTFPETVPEAFLERAAVRRTTARLIGELIRSVSVKKINGWPEVEIGNRDKRWELAFLKRFVWQFVVKTPKLGTQQEGHARIIRCLFRYYLQAIRKGNLDYIPGRFRGFTGAHLKTKRPGGDARIAADVVATFSELEAAALFGRLTGTRDGSVTDLLHA